MSFQGWVIKLVGGFNLTDHAVYRLKLAQGFLREAHQDFGLQRWRSVVDNAQLAIENASKCVLALVVPVARTHEPAQHLYKALKNNYFPQFLHDDVLKLADLADEFGMDIHFQTDYGDELAGVTPWELFQEADAQRALSVAEEAIILAQAIATNSKNSNTPHTR